MKNCLNCKYADWKRTEAMKPHRSTIRRRIAKLGMTPEMARITPPMTQSQAGSLGAKKSCWYGDPTKRVPPTK